MYKLSKSKMLPYSFVFFYIVGGFLVLYLVLAPIALIHNGYDYWG